MGRQLISALLASIVVFGASCLPTEAREVRYQRAEVMGRLLGAVIDSPRYSGKYERQSEEALSIVAEFFCYNMGHNNWLNWKTAQARQSHKMTVLNEYYESGDLKRRWRWRDSKGPPLYFEYITCY